MIDAFTPKESITMKANPNYWGGQVYLDGLKFINLGDAGSDKTYQGLKAGTEQVALLRDPATVAHAKADGFGGSSALTYGGNIVLITTGSRSPAHRPNRHRHVRGDLTGPSPRLLRPPM